MCIHFDNCPSPTRRDATLRSRCTLVVNFARSGKQNGENQWLNQASPCSRIREKVFPWQTLLRVIKRKNLSFLFLSPSLLLSFSLVVSYPCEQINKNFGFPLIPPLRKNEISQFSRFKLLNV